MDDTAEDAVGTVHRFLSAMKRADWEALSTCVADDVVRVGPFGDTFTGRSDYVGFLSDTMPRLVDYHLQLERVFGDERIVVAQLSETMTLPGGPTKTDEVLVFDLTPNGLIYRIGIYIQQPHVLR